MVTKKMTMMTTITHIISEQSKHKQPPKRCKMHKSVFDLNVDDSISIKVNNCLLCSYDKHG